MSYASLVHLGDCTAHLEAASQMILPCAQLIRVQEFPSELGRSKPTPLLVGTLDLRNAGLRSDLEKEFLRVARQHDEMSVITVARVSGLT